MQVVPESPADLLPAIGLVNVGNSCYANAIIQVLRHTYPVSRLFRDPAVLSSLPDTPSAALTKQWGSLQQCFRTAASKPNCTISPKHFLRIVRSTAAATGAAAQFGDGDQHDVADFMQFMLDQFHKATCVPVRMTTEGTPRSREDEMMVASYEAFKLHFASEYSVVIEMFGGQFYQRVQTCDDDYRLPTEHSETYDPFTVLTLPIPTYRRTKCSVYDCLDLFVADETLPEWKARDGAPPRLSQKNVRLWSLPKVLVVQLKRFAGYQVKDSRAVRIDSTLDLSNYCYGYDRTAAQYELYAVANHIGNGLHGHYTADCRDFTTGVWRRYDDNVVQVLDSPGTQLHERNAYLLFYHRRPHATPAKA